MTVVDLRERWAFGRFTAVVPAARETQESITMDQGREFCQKQAKTTSVRRLAAMDVSFALAVALPLAFVLGGISPCQVGLLVIGWSLALRTAGGYVRSLGRPVVRTAATIPRAVIILCAATALLSIVVPDLNTAALSVAALSLGVATMAGRHVVARLASRSSEAIRPATVVRGTAADITLFLARMARERQPMFRVVAVMPIDHPVGLGDEYENVVVLPSSGNVVDHASALEAGALVLLGAQPEESAELRRLVWRLEGRGVGTFLVPVVADLAQPSVTSMGASGIPIIGLATRDVGAEEGVAKVVVDKVLALVALVALLPVLAVTAVAVRATSTGPVLFRQMRVGLAGREFEMLKFRTMTVDAEARRAELEAQNVHDGGTLFKVADDPRITRVGKILRKFSIDELPQLINVLRGEMSLVGPRPSLPAEVANYPLDAHRRFCVRPGLTGLWQVSGRSDLGPEESMLLDTHYVEQWSPGLDIRILARTPKAVLSGDGAY